MLSVREMVDALYQGKRQWELGYGRWVGFEAAHIFPLAYQGHWDQNHFSRWITLPSATGGPINSVQNGLLLRSDIHQQFDSYLVSINPDVCISNIKVPVADGYLRIIIRLYSSISLGIISPANISIKHFLIILNDLLMSFYVGTSARLS